MSKTIVGVFDQVQEAESAAQDLIHHGFDRGDVRVVKPEAVATAGSMDVLADVGLPADDAREYADELRSGGALVAVKTEDTQTPRALDILRAHGLEDYSTTEGGTGTASAQGATAAAAGEARTGQTVPIIEEQVQVGKQRVRHGGVRIHTRIVEKPVQVEVPLRQERVEIERIPADRPASEADLNAMKEGVIEIHETTEEPVITKQARVVGEVRVGKEVEERTEAVEETARKTEVEVEQTGRTEAAATARSSAAEAAPMKTGTAAAPPTFESLEPEFRRDFQSSGYGDRYRIEQFRPAYRYGYDLATSRNLLGSDWAALEPDARRRWEELNPGTWDRFKAAVKYAFERVRGRA